MTIRIYNRAYLPCDPLIAFSRQSCVCSNPPCGIKTPHTTGYAIYFWKYSIYIDFGRPKDCNAPF